MQNIQVGSNRDRTKPLYQFSNMVNYDGLCFTVLLSRENFVVTVVGPTFDKWPSKIWYSGVNTINASINSSLVRKCTVCLAHKPPLRCKWGPSLTSWWCKESHLFGHHCFWSIRRLNVPWRNRVVVKLTNSAWCHLGLR